MTIKNNKTRVLCEYLFAVVVCLLTVFLVLRLWKADLKVPFSYAGDGLYSGVFVKSTMENIWFIKNKFIGAPFTANWSDYPIADNFHLLIIKIISFVFRDFGTVLNIFFILTFVVTMITSLYVLRYLKVGYVISLMGSLLYTFIPYHFLRGEMHLFLSGYFMIPLIVLIFLWLMEGKSIFNADSDNIKVSFFKNNKAIFSIIVCLIVSSTGVYYAFFSCFFILFAVVISYIKTKKLYPVRDGLILILIIGAGLLVNISPSIYMKHLIGIDMEVAKRNPLEADYYGLKMAQLVLPNAGHGIKFLQSWLDTYSTFPLSNEGSEYLGAFGSIGFVVLLIYIFIDRITNKKYELIKHLSKLNLVAILLATIGGAGSLFALIVSPQIRGYNRISIFIAFFAILSLCKLFQLFGDRIKSKNISLLFLSCILIFGALSLVEQTHSISNIDYKMLSEQFYNDDKFVKNVEASLPKNSMIFQLPYVPFPENPPVNNMGDYELFKGYLHSSDLRWSYGLIKGREGDLWQRQVTSKPVSEFIRDISFAGFNGIYIDKFGYQEATLNDLEEKIESVLNVKPIISENGRLEFFSLLDYNKELKSNYSSSEYEDNKNKVFGPLFTSWQNGFSPMEESNYGTWRWCSNEGELVINNSTKDVRTVTIEMMLATADIKSSNLYIKGKDFNDHLVVDKKEVMYKKTLTVSPGSNKIYFSSDGNAVSNPGDNRQLVFRIINFNIK